MTTTFQPRGKLPVAGPSRRERRRERLRGAAAVLGTLLVVVGVPVALVVFIGNPLPTTLPSRDWLTAEITIDVILKVIALVVWAVWAHFVVCLLVELRAARKGSGLPSAVPFGGGNQFVARKLVAAALLLVGAATLAPQASAAGPSNTPGISATAEAAWGARYQAQAVQIAHQQAAAEEAAEASADDASRAPAVEASEVYYTVQPPNGRNHDTLWDIADRTLGDPFRYKEVYALNVDRVQPDGRRMVDADLIFPGWVLMMPSDASGPGLTVVEPIGAPVSAPATPPVEAAETGTETAAAPVSADAIEHASLAGAVGAADETDTVATETDTGRLALGGGLLAAGVLLALSGRRGPYRPETEDEERIRLAADTGTADLLDRALRHLAAGRASQGQALPQAVLAYAGPERVVLHLSGAADSVALQDPPAPWKMGENGRSWSVAADDVAGMTAPDVAAPYPALVNIASTHGYELLVDVEAAPGLVSIGGDGSTAREVAVSMAAELATNVWSDGVRVTLVGFGDDLVEIAPEHMEQVGDLAAVLDEVERTSRVAEELSRSLGINGVLAGRLSRGAERFRPRVLVLSAPPTPAEATRLQQLLSRGRTPLAAVCVGDSVAARWRFVVDSAGNIDLGPLGVSGTARTLAPEQYRGITALLRDLEAGRVERSVEVAAMTPAAGLADASSGRAARAVPAPRAADLSGNAPVQIKLLGPVEVIAPGRIDQRQRPLLVSFVVAVALADEGLHDAVLRATVWPRGVTDEIVRATAAAVTAWLGTDAEGRPRLRQDGDGAWWLSDDVACDFDALRHVAAGDPSDLDSQLAVLALGRGEAFSSATGERFSSFAFARSAQQARVLVTTLARQAGASALSAGRGDLAERALQCGLTLVPTAEPLWRDLLRLSGAEGAPATAENMYAALAWHRVRPEPETDALVEQLVPGTARRLA